MPSGLDVRSSHALNVRLSCGRPRRKCAAPPRTQQAGRQIQARVGCCLEYDGWALADVADGRHPAAENPVPANLPRPSRAPGGDRPWVPTSLRAGKDGLHAPHVPAPATSPEPDRNRFLRGYGRCAEGCKQKVPLSSRRPRHPGRSVPTRVSGRRLGGVQGRRHTSGRHGAALVPVSVSPWWALRTSARPATQGRLPVLSGSAVILERP